jgi:hypothetical protein
MRPLTGPELYFALQYLHAKGLLPNNQVTVMNQITANAFFSSITQCDGALEVGQLFIGRCEPPVLDGVLFEDNLSCVLCKQMKVELMASRLLLEETAKINNPNYEVQTWSDPALKAAWDSDNPAENSCKYNCTSCVFLKNTQKIQINMSTTCSDQIAGSDPTFLNNMEAALRLQTDVQIKSMEKQLNAIGLSTEDDAINQTSQEITEQIKQVLSVTSSFSELSLFRDSALVQQSSVMEPGTNSIISDNNVQTFNLDVLFYAVKNTTIGNSGTNLGGGVYADLDYAIFQTAFEQQDTINDLLKQAQNTGTAIENMWSTAKGKILLIMSVLMIIIIISVSAVFFLAKPQSS